MNSRKKKQQRNKSKRCKKGGLGTFFPKPPVNSEEEIKTLTKDIGRVKLNRIEKSLKQEFDRLKELRTNCISGCKIDACLFKDSSCDTIGEFIQKNNDQTIAKKCSKKFNNLNCNNYLSLHKKILFYLNYIDDVNNKCKNLMEVYKTSILNENTLKI